MSLVGASHASEQGAKGGEASRRTVQLYLQVHALRTKMGNT